MSDYESLTAALGPWFDKPLSKLPAKLRRRVEKDFLIPWRVLSPRRRRMVAVQVDWQHHPDLQQGHQAWWDKHCEIDKCERTASGVPIERRTAADVDLQERKLSELRKELAAIEAILHRTAESLGLVLPGDRDAVRKNPEGAPEAPGKVTDQDHGPQDRPTLPVPTVTRQEWFDATVGDEGDPGSASSRIAARRDRAARKADAPISLNDLPAYWTLYQSIAWIMFRDAAIVDQVTGTTASRFAILLACAVHDKKTLLGTAYSGDAREELLVRLRAGDIQTRGKIAGREGFQTMEALDWIDAKLGEERGHTVLIPARANGKFWFDVVLPKDAIIFVWPPLSIQVSSVAEHISVPPVNAGHGITVPLPTQADAGTASTSEILIANPAISKQPPKRNAGRPNASNTSVSLYERRQVEGCPPGASQLAEAEKIIAMWPTDGPPKPKAKTVSGHISALWSASDKLRDKL
ncbi:MAG: hypothetical protein EXR07_04200 [Acetobacteraceae bacterium]|nr:hypothetical protein [Acetobacteraceae bacterium]